MALPIGASVLVACADLQRSDALVGELRRLGFEPAPVFSAGEAVGALADGCFEALVLDEALDESTPGLRSWLRARYRGVVFLVSGGEPAWTAVLEPAGGGEAVDDLVEAMERGAGGLKARGREPARGTWA